MSVSFFVQLHAHSKKDIHIEDLYTIYMHLEINFSTPFKKKQLWVESNLLESIFKMK